MKRILVILSILTFSKFDYAQDTIIEYNDWAWYKVPKIEAEYKQVIIHDASDNRYNVKVYWMTGEIKMIGRYTSLEPKELADSIIYFYKNGIRQNASFYQAGYQNGDCLSWDEKGNLEEKKHYTGGVTDGEWVVYYTDTKTVKKITRYKTGVKDGEAINLYKNGQKESSTLFVDGSVVNASEWYSNGSLKSEKFFLNGSYDSTTTYWYENGSKKYVCTYIKGKREGVASGWYPDGKTKRSEKFLNDSLIEGLCFSEKGKKLPYFPFTTNASFVGGQTELVKFISKNTVYPRRAKENSISRRVFVDFAIDENGLPVEISIEKKGKEDLDKEAMRVISIMPKWDPATVDGEPIKMWFRIPFNFKTN